MKLIMTPTFLDDLAVVQFFSKVKLFTSTHVEYMQRVYAWKCNVHTENSTIFARQECLEVYADTYVRTRMHCTAAVSYALTRTYEYVRLRTQVHSVAIFQLVKLLLKAQVFVACLCFGSAQVLALICCLLFCPFPDYRLWTDGRAIRCACGPSYSSRCCT